MKNILIVTFGLIIGGLVGGGIIYLVQQKDNGVVNKPDEKSSTIKETPVVLTVREQEFQRQLSESETARVQLQSQVANLQRQLADIKEQMAVSQTAESTIKKSDSDSKASINKANMRRYARAILAMDGKDDALKKDPTLQTAFQEMMGDMMKLMAKNNLVLETRRSMDDEIFNAYGVPEIRQWYCQLGVAMLEELGLLLTEAQITAVDNAMLAASELYKNVDNPDFTRLERAVVLSRFQSEQSAEFARIFTEEQNQKIPDEIVDTMVGRSGRRSGIYIRIDAINKTVSDCSGAVLLQWVREIRLDDAEKQGVKYLADMFVTEQAGLKYSCESEYGKEFMDFYLERYDRSAKDNTNTWRNARNKFFESSVNRAKQETLDLRFAELQVKYQKHLMAALTAKAERIKDHLITVTIFSYLGE